MVNFGEVRLICVAHSEATNGSAVGFNENYIAMLRDKVASQAAQFEQSALLIVHNSLLDTLLNSAIDLGATSAPWNARTVCDDLVLQAQSGQRSALVIQCLLEWLATQIEEEQSSAFAFRQSYESLSRQQDPDFPSMGLFKDKAIFDLTSEGQIQRRLRENRELHEEIATVVHHFPDDIEERLPYLSPSFIKSHFESGVLEPWDRLDIQDFWDEIESHGSTALEFAAVELDAGTLYGPRNTRDTGAGQRRKNLIIAVPGESNTFQLTFVFITDDLDLTHVKRSGNSAFQETAKLDIKKTRNRRRVVLISTFDKSPTYFTISLDRSQTAERFEFHCLAVQEGDFHIAAFENSFLVNVVGKGKAESLTLQTEEQELLINPTLSERRVLDENNSVVDSSEFGTVDFHDLYEDS